MEETLLSKAKRLKNDAREILQSKKFVETYLLTPNQTSQDVLVRWSQMIVSLRKYNARLSEEIRTQTVTQETYDELRCELIYLAHFLGSLQITENRRDSSV